MNHRVVITGLGTVSGLGLNVPDFWQELTAGRSGIRPFDLPIQNVKTAVAAPVSGFDPQEYFSPEELPFLDVFSQFAVVAAQEAIADAGLVIGEESLANAAAIIGSGCCGKHNDEVIFSSLYKLKRKRAHPLTIPRGMPSAAAVNPNFSTTLLSGICTPKMVFRRDADEKKKTGLFGQV